MRKSILVLATALLLGAASEGRPAASERILEFFSRVEISASGSLRVTETIRVVAAGQAIKRGIYRDFPTRYAAPGGRTVRPGFQVVSVARDGRSEPFHLEDLSNGQRVYIGRQDVFIPAGEHTYTLTYLTDRQIGFFEQFDELYWNVTGNDWQFAIDRAGALIVAPPGAEIQRTAAYTGPMGARGNDYSEARDESGNAVFSTTRALNPGEGLTVAVAWPKGFVHRPSTGERIAYLIRDWAGTFTALAALLLVLLYYFVVWLRVGKDPERGIIVARFHPPEGLSPSAVRYILKMGYDNKAFAAAVVDMAVKGVLEIHQADDGEFTLKKTGADTGALSRGERKVFDALLGSRQRITLERSHHKVLSKAVSALRSSLSGEFEKVMFKRNAGYLAPGVVLTFLGLAAVVLTGPEMFPAAFIAVWLAIWSIGCGVLAARVIAAWRGTGRRRSGGALHRAGALVLTMFAAPFFAGWAAGFFIFVRSMSLPTAVLALATVLSNVLFYYLLKAPTVDGRRIMDEIEGFARYLSVAEKERLNLLGGPEKTPQLFQKYLPYAMALDAEAPWSEQFASILADMESGSVRPPVWYHGTSGMTGDWGALASDLGGSLSHAISASSTAPGSSSGSGGGGSSGGGGGGGGGGGW